MDGLILLAPNVVFELAITLDDFLATFEEDFALGCYLPGAFRPVDELGI